VRARIKSGELSEGIKKCKNSPQVVHSELLFFLRGASNLEAAVIDELCEPHNVAKSDFNSIRIKPKRASAAPKQQAQILL
jgi:hypothetical protein